MMYVVKNIEQLTTVPSGVMLLLEVANNNTEWALTLFHRHTQNKNFNTHDKSKHD